MRGSREVGKSLAEGAGVRCLEEHEGHAGAEEDDVGGLVLGKEFMFQVSRATGYQRWLWDRVERMVESRGAYSSQKEMIYGRVSELASAVQGRYDSALKPTLSVSQSFLRDCMSSRVTATVSAKLSRFIAGERIRTANVVVYRRAKTCQYLASPQVISEGVQTHSSSRHHLD